MIEAKFPPFMDTCLSEKLLERRKAEAQQGDGDWKEWDGSADLPPDLLHTDEVDVLFRDGYISAEDRGSDLNAGSWYWKHDGGTCDIIAYRKVVEEATTEEESTPAPEGDGWVELSDTSLKEGLTPPTPPRYEDNVEIQRRDGSTEMCSGREFSWRRFSNDILRYRVVKKEEPSLQQPTTSQYQVGGDHYTNMPIQPWDAAKAWYGPVEYLGYHLITANAYLARHKSKGGLQDIKKARHHLDELIRYFEEEEDYPY